MDNHNKVTASPGKYVLISDSSITSATHQHGVRQLQGVARMPSPPPPPPLRRPTHLNMGQAAPPIRSTTPPKLRAQASATLMPFTTTLLEAMAR